MVSTTTKAGSGFIKNPEVDLVTWWSDRGCRLFSSPTVTYSENCLSSPGLSPHDHKMAAKPPDSTSKAEGSWQRGLQCCFLWLKRRIISLPCGSVAERQDRQTRCVDQLKLTLPARNQEMWVPRWGGVSVRDLGGQNQRSVYGWGQRLVCDQGWGSTLPKSICSHNYK